MKPIEKLGTCAIDEMRRIALPDELVNEPGWGLGEEISIHYIDKTTVILQASIKPDKVIIFD